MTTKHLFSGFRLVFTDIELSRLLKKSKWKETRIDLENRINAYFDESSDLIGFTVFPQSNHSIHYIKK